MPATPWWQGATIYQIYPLSFADSNGDGIGDLRGVIQHLDHVASLGVDAIWLCPFHETPLLDCGYDTTNAKAVDPRFGQLSDFHDLVREAHARGLKVIVDQVYTYTHEHHPWFVASRSSRTSEKHDWYTWANAKPDGSAPNNWLSIFGGPAWEWDCTRRQYYMTTFLPGMPHLDGNHPEVRRELLDVARFWFDQGADGLRLDVINLLALDPQLRSNPAVEGSDPNDMPLVPIYAQQMLYDGAQPQNLEFIASLRALADTYRKDTGGSFLLGEVSNPDVIAEGRHYSHGSERLHSCYHVLAGYGATFSAAALRADLESWNDDTGWPTWSFGNHDTMRPVTRLAGPNPPRELGALLVAILACLRGTVLLYQGDELGLPCGQVPYDKLRDPATKRFFGHYMQRDGARTPMPWWGSEAQAGFSSAATTWLPLGVGHAALAVDVQEGDAGSTLRQSRELLALRRVQPALRAGTLHFIDSPEPVLAFERRLGSTRLACAFNLSPAPAALPCAWPAASASLLGTPHPNGLLPAWSYAVLRLPDVCSG